MSPHQGTSTGNANQPKSTHIRDTDTPRHSFRDLIAVNFGNVLEWYDWTIYSSFAPYFASQFFNPEDETSAFLSTLAVFAVGFIARPIGGFVFGSFADKVGRKQALFFAMLLTAVGSLVIAISPTFTDVGVLASITLVAARLIQGLAHGGEMGTSITYLVERAPHGERARYGSTSWVSVVAGTILATLTALLINLVFSPDQVNSWGWRIAFGLGGILGLYALYMRTNLEETDTFQQRQHELQRRPLAETKDEKAKDSIFTCWKGLLVIFGVSAGGSLMFYIWLIYLPTYAQKTFGQSSASALTASLISQAAFLFLILVSGWIGDRWGRKPLVLLFGLFFAIASYPLFQIVNGSFSSLLMAMLVALAGVALLFGVNGAVWSEYMPTKYRASGVAGVLSLATAIFGGTAPYLMAWLNENGRQDYFVFYMIGVALITAITGLLMKETKDITL